MSAMRGMKGNVTTYAASKAAASTLARSAGLELAGRGIRCNVVEPGSTDTPMQCDLWSDPEAGRVAAIDGDEVTIGLIPETLERTTLGTRSVGEGGDLKAVRQTVIDRRRARQTTGIA